MSPCPSWDGSCSGASLLVWVNTVKKGLNLKHVQSLTLLLGIGAEYPLSAVITAESVAYLP